MDHGNQDRRLKEIESEIGQLRRRLGQHQGKADSISRQLARLVDMRKSLVKKGGCAHRDIEQRFVDGGIVFICADCGDKVLKVQMTERDLFAEAEKRVTMPR